MRRRRRRRRRGEGRRHDPEEEEDDDDDDDASWSGEKSKNQEMRCLLLQPGKGEENTQRQTEIIFLVGEPPDVWECTRTRKSTCAYLKFFPALKT